MPAAPPVWASPWRRPWPWPTADYAEPLPFSAQLQRSLRAFVQQHP